MIDHLKQKILCVAASVGKVHESVGKVHDFALFKSSRLALAPHLELLADTGYQGVGKLHANSQIPHKKSKHHPLTLEQKQENKDLASRRIKVEHALRFLKRFRILSGTYRNRRKSFALRLNLRVAITNLHK